MNAKQSLNSETEREKKKTELDLESPEQARTSCIFQRKMFPLRKEASHPCCIVSTGAGQLSMKRKAVVLETSADRGGQYTKI